MGFSAVLVACVSEFFDCAGEMIGFRMIDFLLDFRIVGWVFPGEYEDFGVLGSRGSGIGYFVYGLGLGDLRDETEFLRGVGEGYDRLVVETVV